MLKLNGYDWSKEDIRLITGAAVCHDTSAQMSKNFVTIELDYCSSYPAVDFIDCDDYIALTKYEIDDFKGARGFDEKIKNGNPPKLKSVIGRYKYYRRQDIEYPKITGELRIYKDRKVACLIKIEFDNGDTVFFVDQSFCYGCDRYHDIVYASKDEFINGLKECWYIVETDEQVKKLAKKITKKETNSTFSLWCGNNCSDINKKEINRTKSYSNCILADSTSDLFTKFFSLNDEESDLSKAYKSLGKKDGKITRQYDLQVFLTMNTSANTSKETKKDKVARIIQEYRSDIETLEKAPETNPYVIWGRNGDNIVLITKLGSRYYWTSNSRSAKIFIYNVKDKTRLVYMNSDFPIPSLKLIADNFSVADKVLEGEVYPVKFILKGVRTVKELFAGTNIDWILSNLNRDECKVVDKDSIEEVYKDPISDRVYPQTWKNEILDIFDLINEERIGSIALSILATSGVPVCEQMLKSKLFNMYFAFLEKSEETKNLAFFDTAKKGNSYAGSSRIKIKYNSKAKNLKTMFGLSMNLLREYDKNCVFTKNILENTDRYYSNTREIPNLSAVQKLLGDTAASIDVALFGKFLQLLGSEECLPSFRNLRTELPNCSPKDYYQILEDYRECWSCLDDYYRMRNRLKNIYDTIPDVTGPWNASIYPLRPGKGTKFFRYFQGMRLGWGCATNVVQFIRWYQDEYKKAYQRGDFTAVTDPATGEFSGILIKLTPAENLMTLHDELSYWISFYQDESKKEEFSKAIQRVKPFEYVDKETGLMIVAPKDIGDLKQEGAILSHCVGSYADAIIGGKDNIMFIRRVDMPDSPFFTLEIAGSRSTTEIIGAEIRQVHCYSNGNLTANGQAMAYSRSGYECYNKTFDIMKFLHNWTRTVGVNKISESSVKASYAALCAVH